jgi:putative peptide zinc metalloprotease protein
MTTTQNPPQQQRSTGRHRARSRTDAPPRLAEGLELLGEYEGSGFKEAPHLARRADGQTLQLTRLLHLVAEAADGQRSSAEIAELVGDRLGRRVSADNITFLVERKLRPLGVLAEADGSSPQLAKPDQLLALKFRTALVPDSVTRALTTVFRPLFWPPIVIAVVIAFVAAMGWVFFVHGIGQGVRSLIYDPALLLVLFAGIVVGTAFHEVGHATACRYGGGRPGVMGAGIYIVWPAFYTDVTDAYRLSKAARLRTDLGGIYFNAIVANLAVGAFLLTGWEIILLLAVTQTFAMVQQLMPFLRMDGYYILSDLTGVPDMLNRIRPVLRSLKPGREADARVTELKPWARRVVSGYVLTLIPVLAAMFGIMLVHAPRAFATAYDSFGVQLDRVGGALESGGPVAVAGGGLQLLMLVLPVVGMVLTTTRVGRRAVGGAWRATEGRPRGRGGLVAGTATAVALGAFIWWPNGEYRPIQPTERGTLQGAVAAFVDIPTGRPALTPQREEALGGAPFERDVRRGDVTRPEELSGREPAGGSDDAGDGPDRRSGEDRETGDRDSPAEDKDPAADEDAADEDGTTTTTPTLTTETPSTRTTPQPAPLPPEPTQTAPTPTTTTPEAIP